MPVEFRASDSDSQSDDDDSFTLPSFAYAVPDDAYEDAPWEKKRSDNEVTRDKRVDFHQPRAPSPPPPPPSPHPAAMPAKVDDHHETKKEAHQTPPKAHDPVSPARSALSSSSTVKPRLSAPPEAPHPKPKPTPALDALTQLAWQGLTGSPSSASRSTHNITKPPAAAEAKLPLSSLHQQHPPVPPTMTAEAGPAPRSHPPHMGPETTPPPKAHQSKPSIAMPIMQSSSMRDLEGLMAPASSSRTHTPAHSITSTPLVSHAAAADHATREPPHQATPWSSSSPTSVASSSEHSHSRDMAPAVAAAAATPLIDLLSEFAPSSPQSPPHIGTRPTLSSPDTPLELTHSSAFAESVPSSSFSQTTSTDATTTCTSEYPSTHSERLSSYQDSAPDSPVQHATPSVPPSPWPPAIHANMLKPEKLSFDYLQQLLRKGDVFVRVEGPKNNCIVWTGDPLTSGYFGRQDGFKGLTPNAYQRAAKAAGLDAPYWWRQAYLWKSMDAHRWPDFGIVPEDSPWISATNNLDWAVWRMANILSSTSTTYMTFIRPTGERFSLPTPPRKAKPSKLTKTNSEVVFYGRIFAESIIARVKWTRTTLPFSLPARFWGVPGLRGRKVSWIYYLRWDPKKHPWHKATALINEGGKLAAWSDQPVKREPCHWPRLEDEDSTPSSSSVGPSTPEPSAKRSFFSSPADSTTPRNATKPSPDPAPLGDLIDFGAPDVYDSEDSLGNLQAPINPDTVKEFDLVS